MSYLAIARKYRPATFDEIVGQEHVTRTLRNALERGRIHHAFLFTGARGVGKTTAARALARSLNCAQGPTATPCGTCDACQEITQGTYPDLIEIDGASNNSVDDVRDLRETVRYPPSRGRWKVYLVDEVHMLSKGAFNALLKTLEEPPPNVVFLFATTEPNRIPDTILSRVQRFDFKRIPAAAVTRRLREICTQEGVEISDTGLRHIARAGEGSMRDAQSLLDQVISFAGPAIDDAQITEILGLIDRNLLYDTLEGMLTGDPARCLEAIDTVHRYGYELSVFTGELLEVIRDASFVRLSEDTRRYVDISGDELQRLEEMTARVDPEAPGRLFTALLDIHDRVSRASRPRIVLEMAVARLATLRPAQPLSQLLGRLEQLERRIRSSSDGRRSIPPSPAPTPASTATASRPASSPRERRQAPQASRSRPSAQDEDPDPSQRVDPSPSDPPRPSERPAPIPQKDLPWETLCTVLTRNRDIPELETVEVQLHGTVLTLFVPSLRVKVTLDRLLKSASGLAAVERAYPEVTSVELDVRANASANEEERRRRALLGRPEVRRIIEGLRAEVEAVIPLDDGEA